MARTLILGLFAVLCFMAHGQPFVDDGKLGLGCNYWASHAGNPVVVTSCRDWIPIKDTTDIIPCSALDFSNMGWRDAPAGKHGRIVAKGSHFEFEKLPGVAQRFHGGGARVCAWLRRCAAVRDSCCAQTRRNPVLRRHLARPGRCDVSLRDCRMTSALDAEERKMISLSLSK